jgi:peptide/nickel transport system substrate-binding protein
MSIHSLSLTGKVIFYFFLAVFIGSALSLLWHINNFFIVEVPHTGGAFTEGVIGLPRFINPVLAITDSDKDLSTLVYAGLMRQASNGELVPDLAESFNISPDGKTYTFVLKPKVIFSDGSPITADDIIYTIQQIQNPEIKSPKHANWNGVATEKIDDRTIQFTLQQAYGPFIENMTLGILPKHLWQSTTAVSFPLSDLNANPIGQGPYKVKAIHKSSNGIPSEYELVANTRYIGGRPLIDTITLRFYTNEKDLEAAYRNHEVDSINSISPDIAKSLEKNGSKIYTATLPRVFGVFFNQTDNPALQEQPVREALDLSVNRDYIVNTVLQGYGTPLNGPVPERFIGDSQSAHIATSSSYDERVAQANTMLDKAGWIPNADGIREKKTKNGTSTLAFAISTSDAKELKDVADILKSEWRKIGAQIDVKVFEGGNLNQNVIRPRKYDALLFGQIVNRDLDLYAFWHSSQRLDPGLNIAQYTSPKADKILENLRTTSDKEIRLKAFAEFESLLAADRPAVFLYSPDFIYVAPAQAKNIVIDNLVNPSERFNWISNWNIDTDRVWKIFAHVR